MARLTYEARLGRQDSCHGGEEISVANERSTDTD